MNINKLFDEAEAGLAAEVAAEGAKLKKRRIPIAAIIKDPALQTREALKMERVEEYQGVLRLDPNGLPPVRAYHEKGKYWVPDGWHRIAAHEAEQLADIEAFVNEGTRADAVAEACRANANHGEPRTNADKRKSIKTLLVELPAWRAKSDRQIMEACQLLDHKLVGVVYRELVADGTLPPRERIETSDGRVIDTKKPKAPAVKCHCGLLAWDGKHCMKHAAEAKQQQSSLLISTPEESSARQQALFGAGPMGNPPLPQDPSSPSSQSPSVSAPPGEESKASELEQAVDAALTKAGPLDPKTCLPASQSNGAKPNGERWQHYNTPLFLIEPARKIDVIALDPCHNDGSLWAAKKTITEKQNSLLDKWDWAKMAQGGLIPINPPYNNIAPFVDKICLEAAKGAQVLLIVPNRSETKWHQKASRSCKLRVELAERVPFLKDGEPDKSPYEPTILFYWGHKPGYFAAAYAPLGFLSAGVRAEEYASAAEKLRERALHEKQAELPILEVPRETAPANVPEVRTPNLLFEKCPHCGDSCARGGDVPAGGACDECELDGIACAVCFGDIEDVRTATLLTPAGATINATWSCASCSAKDAKKTESKAPRLHQTLDLLRAEFAEGFTISLDFVSIDKGADWALIKDLIDDCDLSPITPTIDKPLSPRPITVYELREARYDKLLGTVSVRKAEATPAEASHLAKLAACTTREEYTPLWHQLLSEFRGGSKEHGEILDHYNKHWFALPHEAGPVVPKKEKRGEKEKTAPCHCCEIEHPLSQLRYVTIRQLAVCPTSFAARPPSVMHRVEVSTRSPGITRLGTTFGLTPIEIKVAPIEVGMLEQDKRLAVTRLDVETVKDYPWDTLDYWLSRVSGQGPERDAEQLYRCAELCLLAEYEYKALREALKKHPRQSSATTSPEASAAPANDGLIYMQAWSAEGLQRKNGWVLSEDQVKDVSLTPKQFKAWQNDARIKMRTLDWLEEMTADMKRANTVGEGTRVFDAMIDLTVTQAERDQCRAIYHEWKNTKPATVPYNAKKKLSTEKTRSLGVPLKKPVTKKAGRR